MPLKVQKDDFKGNAASSLKTVQLALLCKAAADPLRLAILRVLSNDTFGVQELAAIFSMPQPGMSHHLKVLAKAGLLVSRRQGNSIFYRHAMLKVDSEFFGFQQKLFETIAQLPLAAEHNSRMDRIFEDRASSSRLYFEKNVDKFEENQGMLCELSQYLPNVRELLDFTGLAKSAKVMEVGPCEGALLK